MTFCGRDGREPTLERQGPSRRHDPQQRLVLPHVAQHVQEYKASSRRPLVR
jgi:hypothetical protein